jgi:purine nucleoside permease
MKHIALPARLLAVATLLLFAAACQPPATDSAAGGAVPAPAAAPAPLEVRAVVVTMFEIGEDSGDQAGEFQLWNERRPLTQVLEFGGHHGLHYDPESKLLVMVTGIGTAKSAASVMMLGMDPRFDLSRAYWLVAGIAGIDPEDASIGSAVWAEYLVDGDLAHEIDPREMPEDWDYGYFARYTDGPNAEQAPESTGELFRLNPELVEWAYQLTADVELPDYPSLAQTRALYTEHPAAQQLPSVLKGDHVAAMTFWHGQLMNDWANDWLSFWTAGEGEFVTSAMEDTGTLQALEYLSNIGRADRNRALVLRTGSNFTLPPPGVSAAQNLLAENEGYAGLEASLESAYRVGSKVIDTLLGNWERYGERTPVAADLQE